MEKIISSVHCVMKYKDSHYCVWNSKYNKYAPIGGKSDPGESEIETLAREIKEEVVIKGVEKLERLGTHTHVREDKTKVNVAMYLLETSSIPQSGKEDFITVVKLTPELAKSLTLDNSYSTLIAIRDKLSI